MQLRRIHLPCSVHQIMGLIYEKGEIGLLIHEESLQACAGVEEIVIITYHAIRPNGQVQGIFKRADPMLFCVKEQLFPIHLGFIAQHIH
ncbi:hypothetical protein SDC9_187671 [bioreactor metagenome]|uniref:Uncharacterized protein n=1 Tax=bioreactor metagenome TaxID=1076179 RepID=A0A645HM60_9ZZZZ